MIDTNLQKQKVTKQFFLLWLLLSFFLGLCLSLCSCNSQWQRLANIRLVVQKADKILPKKATEAGFRCVNKSKHRYQLVLCTRRSPAIQAHMAWQVIGHKLVTDSLDKATLILITADKTGNKVNLRSYLAPACKTLRGMSKGWPKIFPILEYGLCPK
jgi:hypothetical protein